MRFTPPQIDEYVSKEYLRAFGALKEFAARSRFWMGYPQFAMIAVLFYYQSSLIQETFPTIWTWVIFLVVAGMGAMLFEYMVVLPSQITFTAGQTSRENRNPTYHEIMNLHRKFDHQFAVADGGSPRPGCGKCDAAGVPGVHKNRPVWKCPTCQNVLMRDVET